MNYTEKLKLRKPEGGEYYSVEDFNGNADLLDAAITGKINKPNESTTGNIAVFSASGNIEDIGRKPIDFATTEHDHDAAYTPFSHANDEVAHVSADEKTAISAVGNKADKSYVDSALANKVNMSDFKQIIDRGYLFSTIKTDVCDFNTLLLNGKYGINYGFHFNAPLDTPNAYILDVTSTSEIYAVQRAIVLNNSKLVKSFERFCLENQWTEWKEIATATPSQEFNLELTNGHVVPVSCQSIFSKDQFGRVTVNFAVETSNRSESIVDGTVIAVLPVGYRPASGISSSCTGASREKNETVAAVIHVDSIGQLIVGIRGKSYCALGQISFICN